MRTFVHTGIAVTAITLVALSAQAADRRAPARIYKAPPPPIATWNGCYIGGQLGGQQASLSGNINYPGDAFGHPAFNASRDFDGDARWLYGAQIGCNWQPMGGGFVLGVEADWAGVDRGGRLDGEIYRFPALATDHFNTSNRFGSQVSVRLRGGFAIDAVMLYIAGGPTWAKLSSTHSFIRDGDGSLAFDTSSSRTGWNVGVGLEYMLGSSITMGVEYRYTDYGSVNFNVPAGTAGTLSWAAFTASLNDINTQDIRFRLNYLFNSGAVVARY